MWTENKKALSEVSMILRQLDNDSVKKIPQKLLNVIEANATVNVNYIHPDTRLDLLGLEEETKEILAVISYQYFCNDEEKALWNKELLENEKKYQEKLCQKYNPNDIFQNTNAKNVNYQSIENDNCLVEYKENLFRKIWNKLKKHFKRK